MKSNQSRAKTLPRLGVLGGMGPAATILLQQRLLDVMKVEVDSDHLPLLIDMNTQVPSRIDYLIHGRGENPGPVLSRMAKALQSHGADALVMPCCTAHHYADYIEESASIPFLNMVQLAISEIASQVPTGTDVGILASPATEKIELFKKYLQPHGLNQRYTKDMNAMLEAIEAIKKSGPSSEVVDYVQSAIAELEKSEVTAIIVGCSEFSLISDQLSSSVPIVDAVNVLTRAVAKWAQESANGTAG